MKLNDLQNYACIFISIRTSPPFSCAVADGFITTDFLVDALELTASAPEGAASASAPGTAAAASASPSDDGTLLLSSGPRH